MAIFLLTHLKSIARLSEVEIRSQHREKTYIIRFNSSVSAVSERAELYLRAQESAMPIFLLKINKI